MSIDADIVEQPHVRARQFVRRIHRMRVLGMALCALPIGSVLWEQNAPGWQWACLVLNALLWPHLARWISQRSRDRVHAEHRNLVIDAAFGGAWIGVIQLALIPSAILISVLTADRLAAGGWPLLRRSSIVLFASIVLVLAVQGFALHPAFSYRTLLLSLPFLFAYNVALSHAMYRLTSRMAAQNRELEGLTRIDPGIELPNRRHLRSRARRALLHFQRDGSAASLLLIDIDHFKSINDRYGHGMGDLVLKQVADALRAIVRDDDVPARYGGDEFAVLLMNTRIEGALLIASRIHFAIREMTFDAEPGLVCTASIGVTQLAPHHPGLREWISDTDAALYRAKAGGRDRVGAS